MFLLLLLLLSFLVVLVVSFLVMVVVVVSSSRHRFQRCWCLPPTGTSSVTIACCGENEYFLSTIRDTPVIYFSLRQSVAWKMDSLYFGAAAAAGGGGTYLVHGSLLGQVASGLWHYSNTYVEGWPQQQRFSEV